MTIKQAIRTLELFNRWRRGDETLKMQDPKKIGQAIDLAINVMKKSESENKKGPIVL